jgi:hypothetical protein
VPAKEGPDLKQGIKTKGEREMRRRRQSEPETHDGHVRRGDDLLAAGDGEAGPVPVALATSPNCS